MTSTVNAQYFIEKYVFCQCASWKLTPASTPATIPPRGECNQVCSYVSKNPYTRKYVRFRVSLSLIYPYTYYMKYKEHRNKKHARPHNSWICCCFCEDVAGKFCGVQEHTSRCSITARYDRNSMRNISGTVWCALGGKIHINRKCAGREGRFYKSSIGKIKMIYREVLDKTVTTCTTDVSRLWGDGSCAVIKSISWKFFWKVGYQPGRKCPLMCEGRKQRHSTQLFQINIWKCWKSWWKVSFVDWKPQSCKGGSFMTAKCQRSQIYFALHTAQPPWWPRCSYRCTDPWQTPSSKRHDHNFPCLKAELHIPFLGKEKNALEAYVTLTLPATSEELFYHKSGLPYISGQALSNP